MVLLLIFLRLNLHHILYNIFPPQHEYHVLLIFPHLIIKNNLIWSYTIFYSNTFYLSSKRRDAIFSHAFYTHYVYYTIIINWNCINTIFSTVDIRLPLTDKIALLKLLNTRTLPFFLRIIFNREIQICRIGNIKFAKWWICLFAD